MILIIPVIIIIVGYIILTNYSWDSFAHGVGFFTTSIGLFLLLSFLVMGFVVRIETATYIEEREALQETYQHARQFNDFERVAITKDIADFNKALAVDKYWNKTIWFDLFINDVVEEIEPIK